MIFAYLLDQVDAFQHISFDFWQLVPGRRRDSDSPRPVAPNLRLTELMATLPDKFLGGPDSRPGGGAVAAPAFWTSRGTAGARWSRDGAHYNLLNIVSDVLFRICANTVRA